MEDNTEKFLEKFSKENSMPSDTFEARMDTLIGAPNSTGGGYFSNYLKSIRDQDIGSYVFGFVFVLGLLMFGVMFRTYITAPSPMVGEDIVQEVLKDSLLQPKRSVESQSGVGIVEEGLDLDGRQDITRLSGKTWAPGYTKNVATYLKGNHANVCVSENVYFPLGISRSVEHVFVFGDGEFVRHYSEYEGEEMIYFQRADRTNISNWHAYSGEEDVVELPFDSKLLAFDIFKDNIVELIDKDEVMGDMRLVRTLPFVRDGECSVYSKQNVIFKISVLQDEYRIGSVEIYLNKELEANLIGKIMYTHDYFPGMEFWEVEQLFD